MHLSFAPRVSQFRVYDHHVVAREIVNYVLLATCSEVVYGVKKSCPETLAG